MIRLRIRHAALPLKAPRQDRPNTFSYDLLRGAPAAGAEQDRRQGPFHGAGPPLKDCGVSR